VRSTTRGGVVRAERSAGSAGDHGARRTPLAAATRTVRPRGSARGAAPCLLAAGLALALLCGCRPDGGVEPGSAADGAGADDRPAFTDRAAETGLDFVHANGRAGDWHMAEVTGAGAALFDADGDGDLDVYLVQGRPMGPAAAPPPDPPTARLYRNELAETGRLAFTDVTEGAGLGGPAYGMGVAVGDYDGDGRPDLYQTNLGPNRLLRNLGPGPDGRLRFADATARAGVDDPRWSVPAVFFDYDLDGRLDLFVGNYVDYPEVPPVCRDFAGGRDYCGPDAFPPEPDRLFHNEGPGPDGETTFRDVTAEAGLTGGFGPALGVVAADFDGDGRLDLYVANDQTANNLWRNQGDGTFRDVALLAGAAVNALGKAEASMGVDAGDFDSDGDLDLFMTHLVTETNTIFRNDGMGMFEDYTDRSGLGGPSRPYTAFGTAWVDWDNDGWLDLVVANGAVKKNEALTRAGDPFPFHEPNQLFRNLGPGPGGEVTFADVTERGGPAFELSEVSRGIAVGDVDEDGDPDLLVTNNDGPARLLVDEIGQDRPWIGLRLLAGDPPRTAYGAAAAVLREGRPPLWRRVRPDGSFASANDPRLLFGLGDDPAVTGLRVVWPGGEAEELPPPPVGRYTTIVRGGGG